MSKAQRPYQSCMISRTCCFSLDVGHTLRRIVVRLGATRPRLSWRRRDSDAITVVPRWDRSHDRDGEDRRGGPGRGRHPPHRPRWRIEQHRYARLCGLGYRDPAAFDLGLTLHAIISPSGSGGTHAGLAAGLPHCRRTFRSPASASVPRRLRRRRSCMVWPMRCSTSAHHRGSAGREDRGRRRLCGYGLLPAHR